MLEGSLHYIILCAFRNSNMFDLFCTIHLALNLNNHVDGK